MKRSRRAGRSTRGAGWAGEIFQASDSDEDLDQQHRPRPKELHPHAIVNATPAGAHSAVVNAIAHQATLPKTVQQPFHFVDTLSSNNFYTTINDKGSAMDVESFFEEYGLMDPELSAAWDEDHGLRAKRARTASVRKSKAFFDPFI
jgi:hypothetical protein